MSYSRSTIEEANRHLQALYYRVAELEDVAAQQRQTLEANELYIKQHLHDMTASKNTEIEALRDQLQASEQKVIILDEMLHERDEQIDRLCQQERHLDHLLGFAPIVNKLLSTMRSASTSAASSESGLSSVSTENQLSFSFPTSVHSHDITNTGAIRRLAHSFNGNHSSGHRRHFSISEDDDTETDMKDKGADNFNSKTITSIEV